MSLSVLFIGNTAQPSRQQYISGGGLSSQFTVCNLINRTDDDDLRFDNLHVSLRNYDVIVPVACAGFYYRRSARPFVSTFWADNGGGVFVERQPAPSPPARRSGGAL